ncbi:MAG: M4 family metallopeptidase, partial [Leadbetterella sp.]
AMVDREDWLLGEDVVQRAYFPSGALRSLSNPNQGGKSDNGYQPKNMSQYENLKDIPSEDNGGVHVNSGIPNHAFYLFATSQGMSKEKAEKIYYSTLTRHLTRTSNFNDLRRGVILATTELYGNNQELAAAKAAFDAVGIFDQGGTPNGGGGTNGGGTNGGTETSTLPASTGTESLLLYDPRNSDMSLYAGTFNTTANISKITNGNGCEYKPSIPDDGSFVYFVGKDKRVYQKSLTNTALNPVVILSDPSWRNVAVSKNGKVLAVLASQQDNFIYIYDMAKKILKKAKLYNPTYTTGVETGEVLYADSFEWDYSGKFVIYDAFNRIKNGTDRIEYWDVGILKAWDPGKNDFGDGTIEKMFTNLDEGESIGNPTLSKTNTNIFAFDYNDGSSETFDVVAVDFGKSTNNIKFVIEGNLGVNYPDYSRNDRYILFNNTDGSSDFVSGIQMANDKISPSGNVIDFYDDAKWPVFYSRGGQARNLPTSKQSQVITFNPISEKKMGETVTLSASTNSNLPVTFSIVNGKATLTGNTLRLGDVPGQIVVRATQVGNTSFESAFIDQTFCIQPNTPQLSDRGTSVQATNGGPLYQFYVNGSALGGVTNNATLQKSIGGQYTVRSFTTDGCSSASSNAVGTLVLSNNPSYGTVRISPNPSSDEIKISLPSGETIENVQLINSLGQPVVSSTSKNISIKHLSSGSYLARVKTNKNVYTRKVLKN